MARSRNIKPGLFKNELLAEQTIFSRLLFIGLWTLADREGRLEDRPRRIKMELFPCDSDDIDAGLSSLSSNGFIVRYEANNVKVIQIVNFLKHQTPHGTEKDSELPDQDGSLTINQRDKNGYVLGVKRVNNVKSGSNNRQSPLDTRCTPVKEHPDSLIPDSLIPDLNPIANSVPRCPVDKIVEVYHQVLPELPKVMALTAKRKSSIKQRWDQLKPESTEDGVESFTDYFKLVRGSDFLMGKKPASNGHKVFVATLEWLVNESNFIKVCERNYHERV
jgi:hypothetical protein